MSSPRIIAGKAKGIRLKSVPGTSTRPITDRVKEALFNILAGDIQGATLLDAFAGTGSVGIEALSRGAEWVRFIDNKRQATETIKINLKNTNLSEKAEVILSDTLAFLKRPHDTQYDYIFIAPPQYHKIWSEALKELDEQPDWLSPDGWLIIQIDPVEYEKQNCRNFIEFEQRRYGSTLLVFFEKLSATEENE